MGLLQKLSVNGLDTPKEVTPVEDKPVVQKKSNSVGLLKKSLLAGENRRLDFFEFTDKYNFDICAFLKAEEGSYRIYNCTGFDGESVCLSVSSEDFWDGTLSESNKLYSYKVSSSEALPFLQFFSAKLKEKISDINVLKTINNSIVIICNKAPSNLNSFISDIEAVEKTETAFEAETKINPADFNQSFKIDFSEALESFIISNSKNDVVFTKVIVDELFYNLQKNFPEPSKLLYSPKGKFTIYLKESDLPVELLYNHLRIETSFILGNHSELLVVNKSNDEVEQ